MVLETFAWTCSICKKKKEYHILANKYHRKEDIFSILTYNTQSLYQIWAWKLLLGRAVFLQT